MRVRFILLSFVVFLSMFWWFTPLVAQDSSAEVQAAVEVIRGLRDRRLFELAEIYARDQLQSEAISSSEKALVVLEQIQLKVAQAIASNGNERQIAWQEASQIRSSFEKQFPSEPKQLLINIQDALVNFSHGNLIQQELDAEIAAAAARQQALDQFRQATSKFREIEKTVVAAIPLADSTSENGDLTQDELINLKNNIRYRMAVVNLAKAQLYEAADKLNRIDALSQVLQRLDEVITQSNNELPLWWNAQISKAKCFRLMQNYNAFRQLFMSLPKEFLNDSIKTEFLTERVLEAVDSNRQSKWQDLLSEYVQIKNPTPTLRLAVLRMLMADASQSSGSAKQKRQEQASELIQRIELDHGRYWGRRAEIVLVGAVVPSGTGDLASGDLEILIRQGNTAFRKKNFDDAIKAYTKAIDFAIKNGRGNQALSTAVRLAQSHEQLKQHNAAANVLFVAADKFRNDQAADAVHLRGCWNLGQLKQEQQQLVEKLKLQIARWPNQTSTNQARLWLGNAMEKKGEWQLAIESYLAIPMDSPFSVDANNRVGVAANQWVDQLKKNNADWKRAGRQFIGMVDLKIEPPIDWDWTTPQQSRCVAVVEVGLKTDAMEPLQALYLLESIVLSEARPSNKVRAWQVVATAKHIADNPEEAEKLIELVKQMPNDPSVLRICISGIKQCLTEAQQKAAAAGVEMICRKALVEGKAKDREFWVIEKAIAATQSNRSKSATTELSVLAEKYPRSLRIQLAYARALTLGNSELAIHQWRRLSSKVKPENEAWYEAKYNIVALMLAAGQTNEATKLVKYLEATTSGWQDSSWKTKFDRMIR